MTQPPGPPYPPGGRVTSGEPWQAFLAALLGILIFVMVDVVAFVAFFLNSAFQHGGGTPVVVGAVILVLVAAGGGLLAVRGTSYFTKGLGLGLILGWALLSIFTGGICTGLNPSYFSPPPR